MLLNACTVDAQALDTPCIHACILGTDMNNAAITTTVISEKSNSDSNQRQRNPLFISTYAWLDEEKEVTKGLPREA